MTNKTKAVFLDRDGIINKDCAYPHKPEQIVFTNDIFAFCKYAIKKGYILVVVTNQAGVAKGHFVEDDVKFLHKWMNDQFIEQGINISGFYYCPYHKDGIVTEYAIDSEDRKPNPGMILKAVSDFNIDVRESIMIGDKLSDRIKLDGLRSVVIKSGYTKKGYDVENLGEIEDLI